MNSVLFMTCPHCSSNNHKKKGFFYRKISRSYHQRYTCLVCKKSYSRRTQSLTYNQKRPDLLKPLYHLICSGVSLRQSARVLGCSRLTVDRKVRTLSLWAKRNLEKLRIQSREIYIDEMETIEHTKLKPLSIGIAVNEHYQIIGVSVGKIPAKGLLSSISIKKYGPRPNERTCLLNELFDQVQKRARSFRVIKSDSAYEYKTLAKRLFPNVPHEVFNAADYKEKKKEALYQNHNKRIFNPLFPVDQRCAQLRSGIKRLVRRSWCTTKCPQRLLEHLEIFMLYNNKISLKIT